MDGRNWWVEKGGSRCEKDETIVERIMLRFRPIAPKPVAAGSVPGSAEESRTSELIGKERKKRKYVRVKQTRRCKVDKKKGEVEENIFDFELLQPKSSGFIGSSINLDFKVQERVPGWMKLDHKSEGNNWFFGGGGTVDEVDRRAGKVVESWVIVEGMSMTTDMWFVKEGGLGNTDMEKMKNLEIDVCPGLISDGFDRVQWMNLAYRKLVDPHVDGGEPPAEEVAWLVVKEKLPATCEGFACTVRVVYSWRNNSENIKKKKYVSQTMPCDVWRMDFGGFAWRLDSKAALSLGR